MAPVAEWWQRETFIPLDWSPPPVPSPPRRRRGVRALVAAVMTLLVASTAVFGGLAWKEQRTVQKDRAVMRVEAAQLALVDTEMTNLRTQVSALTKQTGSLQSQLASRRQLLTSASTVAGELQACIDAGGPGASSGFFGLFGGGDRKAQSICNSAEADYQQLLGTSSQSSGSSDSTGSGSGSSANS